MRNSTLTCIPGLLVGHDTNLEAHTGCTVILTPQGAVAAVDVRGGAPGTRETDLLRPENLVTEVHAIVLSGGSAFGLAAADGVAKWLYERNCGFQTPAACVPIVPAAVLYDLQVGRADVWPDAAAGYRACEAASAEPVPMGRVGAGTGATVAKLHGSAGARPGGLGSAAMRLPGGGRLAALVAVNALGEIVDPDSGRVVVGSAVPDAAISPGETPATPSTKQYTAPQFPAAFGQNTTIGVIATDLALSKAECLRVAQMAHDGLARAIRPSHTLWDGDTLFVLSIAKPLSYAKPVRAGRTRKGDPGLLGIQAADLVAKAVLAVWAKDFSPRRQGSAANKKSGQTPFNPEEQKP